MSPASGYCLDDHTGREERERGERGARKERERERGEEGERARDGVTEDSSSAMSFKTTLYSSRKHASPFRPKS